MSYIYHEWFILEWERHIYYQCLFIHVFDHQCVIFNTINTYHQCVILTPWAQFYVHSGDEEWDGVQTPRLDLIVTLHGVVVVVQVDYPSLSRLTGVKLLPTQGVFWKTSDNLHQYQEWTDVQTLYNSSQWWFYCCLLPTGTSFKIPYKCTTNWVLLFSVKSVFLIEMKTI